MRIVFRVDASEQMGHGHVMRCLTLAQALRAEGAEVLFVTRAHRGHLAQRIAAQGFAVSLLEAVPAAVEDAQGYGHWLGVSLEADAEETKIAIQKHFTGGATGPGVTWLIVDHYALDCRWHRRLRPLTRRLLVIDDLADRDCDCDLLLDQTLGRRAEDYRARVPQHCRLLLGTGFALLRCEFAERRPAALARRKSSRTVRRLLINFGGSDPRGLTLRTLRALTAVPGIEEMHIDIVSGREGIEAERLREFIRAHHWQARLWIASDRMAELMAAADLALGAAGAATWERCALGLPTALIVVADNQRAIASAIAACGAGVLLGEADSVTDAAIAIAVGKMLGDFEYRYAIGEQAAQLCDGLGCGRVLAQLRAFENGSG